MHLTFIDFIVTLIGMSLLISKTVISGDEKFVLFTKTVISTPKIQGYIRSYFQLFSFLGEKNVGSCIKIVMKWVWETWSRSNSRSLLDNFSTSFRTSHIQHAYQYISILYTIILILFFVSGNVFRVFFNLLTPTVSIKLTWEKYVQAGQRDY